MGWTSHLLFALMWLSFGVLHSIMARAGVKTFLQPYIGTYYRLFYNLFALAHFLLIAAMAKLWLATGAHHFQPSAWLETLMLAMQLSGGLIFAVALFHYDLGLFSGLRQIREGVANSDSQEPLSISGLHRYVRHPLYTGAHLLLWGGVNDELSLANAMWGSLYLFVGSYFEERALVREYGDTYSHYQQRVPAVVPWKGRI